MEGEGKARLLDQAPDAIIYADRAGAITYWNAEATRVFGIDAEEALGRRLDLIIPEQYREAHWTGFERALGDGKTRYAGQALPTRALRGDGTTIYVELAFAIVKDGEGQVEGALAFARDITARFQADRELRRRLRELEQPKGA